ncbi:MAG: DUF2993 domain-containing protein [Fimbriimonadia bacterium]|jgi:hypothetical protein
MKLSAGQCEVRLTGVVLDNGLTLDEVVVETGDVSYEADRLTFVLPGRATISARMSAESIVSFVVENSPDAVQDLQVVLQDGTVKVSARMQGLLPLGVEAVGSLEVVQGTQIAFHPSSVRVAGMGAPDALVERVLESVNPLLDVSALPFPVQLQRVEVTPREVRVQASGGPIRISRSAT